MKKRQGMRLWGVFLALAVAALTPLAAAADDADFIVGNNSFHDTGVYGKDGYFGPWYQDGCISYENGALVMDTSVDNAWITLNFINDTLDVPQYKYMVIKIKADNPAQAKGFTLTVGQLPGKREGSFALNGKVFTDLVLADGSHPSGLTTSYQTFCVDIAKNGATTFMGKDMADFAMNKGDAGNAKISVSEIYLTNKAPASTGKTETPAVSTPPAVVSRAPAGVSSVAPGGSSVPEVVVSAAPAPVSSVPVSAPTPIRVSPLLVAIIVVAVLAAGTVTAIILVSKKNAKA